MKSSNTVQTAESFFRSGYFFIRARESLFHNPDPLEPLETVAGFS